MVVEINNDKPEQLSVNEKAWQDRVKEMHEGDVITLEFVSDDKGARTLKALSVKAIPVGPGRGGRPAGTGEISLGE